MKLYVTNDGREVSATEALGPNGVLRDGYGMRVRTTVMDGARTVDIQPGAVLTDQQKADAIDARDKRLSEAWKNPRPVADTAAIQRSIEAITDTKARYDARVSNAWRT